MSKGTPGAPQPRPSDEGHSPGQPCLLLAAQHTPEGCQALKEAFGGAGGGLCAHARRPCFPALPIPVVGISQV